MADIYIDVEEVMNSAKTLSNLKKEILEEKDHYIRIRNMIEESWQSQYTEDYIEKINNTIKKFDETAAEIGELVRNLCSVVVDVNNIDHGSVKND